MPKMGKSFILLLLLTLTMVGCSNKEVDTKAAEDSAVPVQVEQVVQGAVSDQAGIVGKFSPNETAQIAPKVNGKILDIQVKLGQSVKKGDILFTLDPSDLQHALAQSKAAYQVALANLKQAENSSAQGLDQAQSSVSQMENGIKQSENAVAQAEQAYRDAESNAQRIKQLFDAGAISAVEWEKAQTGIKNAEIALANAKTSLQNAHSSYENAKSSVVHVQKKSAVDVAKASVAQAKASLDNAQDQLANAFVKAPIAGIIANVNGSTGQMAGPQSSVVTIVNMDPVLVKANLSENEVTKIKVGTPVTIDVPAIQKELNAKVTAISPVMDQQLKAYPMEISISNPNLEWKSDMVVNIKFNADTQSQAKMLVVPRQAVFEEQGKKFVYKIESNQAKKVEVTTGEETSTKIEIKSGLSLKETVVVKGQSLLKDGAKVEIQKKK